MHRSYERVHADWVNWLMDRIAVTGPHAGEPINLTRIAERTGVSGVVVSRWRTGERTDLRLQQWGALLEMVMEEIGGTRWSHAQKRAVYWGGPRFFAQLASGKDVLPTPRAARTA